MMFWVITLPVGIVEVGWPSSSHLHLMTPEEPETDLEPLQISPRAQITESAVPLPSKTLEDTVQSHCNTAGSLQSRPLTSLPAVPVATGGSTPSPRLSPRPSMQSSPRFHGDDTLGSRMTLSSADCEAVGSQISYVLKVGTGVDHVYHCNKIKWWFINVYHGLLKELNTVA